MVEETRVPGGNHRYVIRAENDYWSLLYGATSSAAIWDRTQTSFIHLNIAKCLLFIYYY
jgi:hypothetical protein